MFVIKSEKWINRVSWTISIVLHAGLFFIVIPTSFLKVNPHFQGTHSVKIILNEPINPPKQPELSLGDKTAQDEVVDPVPQIVPAKPVQSTVGKPQLTLPKPQLAAKTTQAQPESSVVQAASAGVSNQVKPFGMPSDRDQPSTTNIVAPVYPKEALNNNWAGTVKVLVTINTEGKPVAIVLLQSSGHRILDESFIRTIKNQYTFAPKRFLGQAIEGTITLSYTFELDHE